MKPRRAAFSPIYALGAAVLFGVSTPLAKILVGQVPPILLAGLLYLGSGLGLGIIWIAQSLLMRDAPREAPLRRSDMPWLGGAIAFGGVAGPILLMVGLALTSGSAASLLLNLEAVFTALLAWLVFRENCDRRILLGMGLIVAGGVVLGWGGPLHFGSPWGAIAIAGACLCWGLDNNLTARVSGGNPVHVACLKGLVAGSVNLILAFSLGAAVPGWPVATRAAVLGVTGYGLSLMLFVLALRHLGAARTGAYFSSAPFVGAIVALLLLHEPLTASMALAAALMGLGVWLHLTEQHGHMHLHAEMLHEHRHHHDDHHQHEHDEEPEVGKAHVHVHQHRRLGHAHHHYPDLHHHHEH
ncbi:MAG: DMT family transporter [Armatimonadia bacterium]